MQGKGKHTNYSQGTVVAWNIDGARRGNQEQQEKGVYQWVLQNMYWKAENKWQTKGMSKERPKKADKGTGRKDSVEKGGTQWNSALV